jgi:hypothetical protein
MLLGNDTDVDIPRVLGGIHVQVDGPVAAPSISRPTCFVTVELPLNQDPAANLPAAAYTNVTLAAGVRASENSVIWEPTARSRTLLTDLPVLPAGERGYLARLFLKGNFIWSAEDPERFLDGEAFGIRPANSASTALRLPSGNQRRGGDFETWFWLRRPRPAGPLVFTFNTLVAATVRGAGMAEALADVVLTATGGTPTPPNTPVPLFNIQVFLNTNLTSPTLTGGPAGAPLADVVLLIDDPSRLNTTHLGATTTPPVVGVGGSGVDYAGGAVPNIFVARRASETSVIFTGVPIDPPGDAEAGASRVLRIKNLRANASQLAAGTTVPGQITAFVSISGAVSAPVENPTQQIALPQAGTVFTVRTDGEEAPFEYSRREGVNVRLAQDPTRTDAVTNFHLEFREGFPIAFKVRKQGPGSPTPARPGEEAGYDNQGPGSLPIQAGGPLPAIGVVSSGTRFQARFQGVPSGVRLFVTTRDVPERTPIPAPDNPPPTAVLIPLEGTGAPVQPEVPRGSGGATGGVPIQELPVVGGVASAIWEWVSGQPASATARTVRFGVVLAAPPITIPLPAAFQASVRGNLAPVSTAGTAGPPNVPVPRFADVGTERPAFRAV